MVDMAMIGGISNSLNVALNISKAMLGIRDQALIQEKVLELTGEIISAQQAAVSAIATQTVLTERIRELEQQIVEMKAWDSEKQKYQLQAIGSRFFTYTLKSDAESGDPPHWLCSACYQNGKKSVLSSVTKAGSDYVWKCPACGAQNMVNWNYSPENPLGESQ